MSSVMLLVCVNSYSSRCSFCWVVLETLCTTLHSLRKREPVSMCTFLDEPRMVAFRILVVRSPVAKTLVVLVAVKRLHVLESMIERPIALF